MTTHTGTTTNGPEIGRYTVESAPDGPGAYPSRGRYYTPAGRDLINRSHPVIVTCPDGRRYRAIRGTTATAMAALDAWAARGGDGFRFIGDGDDHDPAGWSLACAVIVAGVPVAVFDTVTGPGCPADHPALIRDNVPPDTWPTIAAAVDTALDAAYTAAGMI